MHVALAGLARGICVAECTAREHLRGLARKGCVKLHERGLNLRKRDREAEEHLRALFRTRRLSAAEFDERLEVLGRLVSSRAGAAI